MMASRYSCSRDRGISTRVSAEHVWPELMKQPNTAPMATAAGSASSRMMLADLPPSSRPTRLTVSAGVPGDLGTDRGRIR